jgi:hypothetical protein
LRLTLLLLLLLLIVLARQYKGYCGLSQSLLDGYYYHYDAREDAIEAPTGSPVFPSRFAVAKSWQIVSEEFHSAGEVAY